MQTPRFCLIIVIGLPINLLPVRTGRKAFCSLRYSGSTVCDYFFFTSRTVYVPNWCLSLALQSTFPRPAATQSTVPHFLQMGRLRHRTGYLTTVMQHVHKLPSSQDSRHCVEPASTQLLRLPRYQITTCTWF